MRGIVDGATDKDWATLALGRSSGSCEDRKRNARAKFNNSPPVHRWLRSGST